MMGSTLNRHSIQRGILALSAVVAVAALSAPSVAAEDFILARPIAPLRAPKMHLAGLVGHLSSLGIPIGVIGNEGRPIISVPRATATLSALMNETTAQLPGFQWRLEGNSILILPIPPLENETLDVMLSTLPRFSSSGAPLRGSLVRLADFAAEAGLPVEKPGDSVRTVALDFDDVGVDLLLDVSCGPGITLLEAMRILAETDGNGYWYARRAKDSERGVSISGNSTRESKGPTVAEKRTIDAIRQGKLSPALSPVYSSSTDEISP